MELDDVLFISALFIVIICAATYCGRRAWLDADMEAAKQRTKLELCAEQVKGPAALEKCLREGE
jgi:hypothetical protein